MSNRYIDRLSWLLIFALGAIWSTTFPLNEVALRELDPFTAVLGRVAFGAVIMWLYIIARGYRIPADARTWAGFALLGLLNNALPFSLIVWGQTHILSGEAAILNATTPLSALAVGFFFFGERTVTVNRIIGMILGVLGVTIMIGLEPTALFSGVGAGYIAVLGASISYGFAAHTAKIVSSNVAGPVAATCMLTMSTILMIPVVALVGSPIPADIKLETVLAVAAVGVAGAALAYILYFAILHRAGATNLMLVTIIVPVGAIILGAMFLGERFGANDYAGFALIAVSLIIIDGRVFGYLRTNRPKPSAPANSDPR